MKAPTRSRRLAGFTLLEMLVVMMLTAMIATILMQALGQVFALDNKFGRELFNTQQGAMHSEWFRQSMTALTPDRPNGEHRFKGTARDLAGLTMSPLDASIATLAPFAWRIEYNSATGRSELIYGRESPPQSILSWAGNSGAFVYLDEKLATHEAWPPPLGGPWPQLPQAVRLTYRDLEGDRVVIAVPRGPREALPRLSELLGRE